MRRTVAMIGLVCLAGVGFRLATQAETGPQAAIRAVIVLLAAAALDRYVLPVASAIVGNGRDGAPLFGTAPTKPAKVKAEASADAAEDAGDEEETGKKSKRKKRKKQD